MEFEIGQRVRVTAEWSKFSGRQGEVLRVAGSDTCSVRLDDRPDVADGHAFFTSELEAL